ncbi:hypothetical protein B0H13DRAFT_1854572 [Mycena leptocephala]|nr:hypothetical protein B0H13DRAFT_1854572 [Mycena leptocephala]
MNIEPFILRSPPTPSGRPLSVAAKRYRYNGEAPKNGITLLMFHGLDSSDKEQWEPVLDKLFCEKSNVHNIREAWSFDWQSHGESAVLNEEALKDDPKSAPLDLWGYAIAGFLKSGLVDGHRLVGVGYSFGNIALIDIQVAACFRQTWNTHREDIQAAFDMVTNAVKYRRDVWTSKEAAHQFFMGRFPWNSWDPRTVALFAEHALKESKDKDGNFCVVRKCPMIHEASAFQVNLEVAGAACEQLSNLCDTVPIHVVFGETVDLS